MSWITFQVTIVIFLTHFCQVTDESIAGFFALFDAGSAMVTRKLLTPYRNVRYHLKEWSANPPVNKEELFNLRHAMKRVRAEIGNGLLKGRFRVLREGIEAASIAEANLITQACGHVHNFIQHRHGNRESVVDLLAQIRMQERLAPIDESGTANFNHVMEPTDANTWRDQLATECWQQYQQNQHQRAQNDLVQGQVVPQRLLDEFYAAVELNGRRPSRPEYFR
jgi:hypothetical protein